MTECSGSVDVSGAKKLSTVALTDPLILPLMEKPLSKIRNDFTQQSKMRSRNKILLIFFFNLKFSVNSIMCH